MKLFLTIATLIYGVVPAIADLNETHLFNAHWSPHARLHGAWFLFFGFAMAMISVYLVWIRDKLILPSIIGLSFVTGFWLASLTAPLYGGALVDENGISSNVLGIDANVFVFSLLTLVLLIVLFYAISEKSRSD